MIYFNHTKLHSDILVRLNTLDISQRDFEKKGIISRATLFRIQKGHPLQFLSVLKIITWLDTDINKYLIVKYKSVNGRKKEIGMKHYLEINK